MSALWLALAKRISSTRDTGFRLSGVKHLLGTKTLQSGALVTDFHWNRDFYINPLDRYANWKLRAVWRACIGSLVASFLALGQVKTTASCDEGAEGAADTFHILPTRTRQRQFFKYERRLRENSSAEKIFEYFANFRGEKGEPLMSEEDVMRSFCPVYPPSGSNIIRSGSLRGEDRGGIDTSGDISDSATPLSALREMMKIDGKEGISLHEWLLIDALISFPIHDIHILFRMIDTDGNGVIDVEELLKLFVAVQSRSSIDHTGLQGSHRGLLESTLRSSSLVKSLIKGHHKNKKVNAGGITAEALENFCESLRNDLSSIEFNYYSQGTGSVSGENLAISLVSCADIQVIDQYLDRVDDLPENLKNVAFDLEDYKTVLRVISNIKDLASAAIFYVKVFGPIDREVFGKLVSQIKRDTGQTSQAKYLDILFYLFSDSNGKFYIHEMYGVLKHHFQNRTFGVKNSDIPAHDSFFTCCLNCLRRSTHVGSPTNRL